MNDYALLGCKGSLDFLNGCFIDVIIIDQFGHGDLTQLCCRPVSGTGSIWALKGRVKNLIKMEDTK